MNKPGLGAVGDPELGAGETQWSPLLLGPGGQRKGIAAAAGLGEGKGARAGRVVSRGK